MTRDFVTIVSGLPRSGTSMLMRMVEAGGIPAVTDGLRGADDDNPRGYWELEDVKRLPEEAAWIADANGRAVKVVSALLERLPGGPRYRVLFVERDLREVLASQKRMLQRRGEPTDRVPDEQMAALFRKHLTGVLAKAGAREGMELLVLAHATVLKAPAEAAARIDEFLGRGLDCDAMAAAVDSSLWRQRA